MKVALVHDWLNQMGGAENVLITLKEMFPDAPVYTSIYDPRAMPPIMRSWDIRTSFLNWLPGVSQHHQRYLPLYPLAFERFDFSAYDLVLSNKSGFCHGIITPPTTLHLCYCLAPTRFLWNFQGYIEREGLGRMVHLLQPMLTFLRLWDQLAAQRPDGFIAISRAIQARIAKYYRRESTVIYPPVETARFVPAETRGDYAFIASRLVPYKRIDLAIHAFNQLGRPLVIAGEGRDRASLEAISGPTIRFLGRVDDAALARWMASARLFLFPGEEDFGIAPLEAQAAGCPVVAFGAGGALDTIIDGETGVLFHEPTAEALAAAVCRLDQMDLDVQTIRANAQQFDTATFKQRMMASLEEALAAHRASQPHTLTREAA